MAITKEDILEAVGSMTVMDLNDQMCIRDSPCPVRSDCHAEDARFDRSRHGCGSQNDCRQCPLNGHYCGGPLIWQL